MARVDRLCGALGRPVPDAEVAAELEAFLAAAWRSGSAAWPSVALDPDAFVGHLADRIDGHGELLPQLAALRTNDLYLACACALGVPTAVTTFERALLEPLDRALERLGIASATIDEIKQVLRVRFFVAGEGERPRIHGYGGRGELRSWVRASAVRVAHKLRGERAEVADDEFLVNLGDGKNLELDFLKQTYRAAFEEAMREAFGQLPPRDRNLLRYYFEKNLSIDQLGVVYHVHRATAARRIRSANESLVSKTRHALARRLGIDLGDVASILELVQSHFERALRAVLATA